MKRASAVSQRMKTCGRFNFIFVTLMPNCGNLTGRFLAQEKAWLLQLSSFGDELIRSHLLGDTYTGVYAFRLFGNGVTSGSTNCAFASIV